MSPSWLHLVEGLAIFLGSLEVSGRVGSRWVRSAEYPRPVAKITSAEPSWWSRAIEEGWL